MNAPSGDDETTKSARGAETRRGVGDEIEKKCDEKRYGGKKR